MNNKTIKNWLSLAEYDLDTAKAMLDSGRYLYVMYTCQQSIEKLFKAIYVKEKGVTPPFTHNLRKLLSELSIIKSFKKEWIDFIDILNSYYLESRYSEEIEELSRSVNKDVASEILYKTKSVYTWLKEKIE